MATVLEFVLSPIVTLLVLLVSGFGMFRSFRDSGGGFTTALWLAAFLASFVWGIVLLLMFLYGGH